MTNEARYLFLPACLYDIMEEVSNLVEDSHNLRVKADYGLLAVTKYKDAVMDFDGNDPDRI